MKRNRLQKLMAVYERFGAEIDNVPDPIAQQLHSMSVAIGESVITLRSKEAGPKPSEIACGLEEGLRDTTLLVSAIAEQWRPAVVKALQAAISAEYPEFQDKEAQRLEKILGRGKIKTESEFYLVRCKVDTLEGDPQSESLLFRLYEILEKFEQKA